MSDQTVEPTEGEAGRHYLPVGHRLAPHALAACGAARGSRPDGVAVPTAGAVP